LSKSLSFKMLVHKYNFLLQILKKLMDTSYNFIATKTCPSCEFLVVSGHFRPKKCGAGAGWKCAGRELARFLKFLRVRDGNGQKNSTRAGLCEILKNDLPLLRSNEGIPAFPADKFTQPKHKLIYN